ncbi:hypothetical protein BIV57_20470 [Mangrovactinospora gilvigrisea]|uniref:Type II secretion system protein GspF domain-containing protein n=1 Tax=Mangrovactinospora gilvigrisea TaxID=1428644 RepID=A0A1J7BAG6_9ACTN|nr:type II secretion system F family protein [Mangrovactinospora gilvigrisea]OIV35651.1 hypothetical protein BIV57_20470 [Mangrovactinospora gilvigrisea]
MDAAFTQYLLLGILGGAAVGGGIYLAAVGVRGLPPRPPRRGKQQNRAADLLRLASTRLPAAIVLAGLVGWMTKWPVAAVAVGILAAFWPQLFGGAAGERRAIQRIEALASWTESLRDTIAGAVGLEQAIPASARVAAPALREPLGLLIDRLRARMPLPEALQSFADDLDDPSADLVVAALVLNARLRGPGLREVLGALATAARSEVEMRQRITAQRASTRRSVQIVVIFSVGVIVALAVLNHDFVKPYDAPLGQLILLVVFLLFAAGFWWLRKLSVVEMPSRFMTGAAEPSAEQREEAAQVRAARRGGAHAGPAEAPPQTLPVQQNAAPPSWGGMPNAPQGPGQGYGPGSVPGSANPYEGGPR